MLCVHDLIWSFPSILGKNVTLVRKVRLREVAYSPEIAQQVSGGTGFLLGPRFLLKAGCFPLCEMQRPFKGRITPSCTITVFGCSKSLQPSQTVLHFPILELNLFPL